jgi:surfeit locus 1 family protein
MIAATERRLSSRAMLAAALCTVLGIAVLVSLARWQADRAVWKEGLIAELSQRLAAAPVELPPPAKWPDLTAETSEYLRVRFAATEQPDEALVFTGGSSFRPDVTGPGYWVMALARLPEGGAVVVNRGFVPEGRQDPQARAAGAPDGATTTITGVLRWPEAPGLFTPRDEPERNLWFTRDHSAIARDKGWGPVAPFYVEQEAPQVAGGLPQAGKLVPILPNNHRQYEFTWAALAVVLAGVFTAFFWRWYRAE